MKTKANKFGFWKIITLAILAGVLIFLIYPITRLLIQSFYNKEGNLSLANFTEFFSNKYYFSTIINSLKLSIIATVTTILLATPIAYFMSFYKIRGAKVLEIIIILASMSAPFIGAYSWILLLGRNGIITNFFAGIGLNIPDIYGFAGILLVFTFQLYSLVFLYAKAAFENLDASLMEASENLGVTGFKRFRKIILPLVTPSLLAGGLLVFMRCMSDFGTPMLIGEGYRTFPVLIYNEFVGEVGQNQGFASAIAIIAIIVTSVIFLIQKKISEKNAYSSNFLNPVQKTKLKGAKGLLIHLIVYIIVGLSILPQAYLILTSFKNTSGKIFIDGYSLKSYHTAFARMGTSIRNTLLLPLLALIIIIILSVLIAYIVVRIKGKLAAAIDVFTMVPFILPGVVIGIALLTGFGNGMMGSNFLVLGGTMWIVIVSFVIRRLPYTLRSATSTLQSLPISLEEASYSLGASKFKTFAQITLPLMMRGVVAGSILSYVTLISELSSSIILTNLKTRTMTVSIYTEVVRGNYGVAAALATMLTAFTILALIIFNMMGAKKNK
ncbi:iron ABC transporter permease [uncultured Anaerococcus sp.]|uniref:ABC transporter permease n=1 Tax=uncultured Anaerococcus sp. TaxID=293428 RepID=UPI00280BAC63|nr:iron ABC transporter permease [uncultured Anaerococcus sp.]